MSDSEIRECYGGCGAKYHRSYFLWVPYETEYRSIDGGRLGGVYCFECLKRLERNSRRLAHRRRVLYWRRWGSWWIILVSLLSLAAFNAWRLLFHGGW